MKSYFATVMMAGLTVATVAACDVPEPEDHPVMVLEVRLETGDVESFYRSLETFGERHRMKIVIDKSSTVQSNARVMRLIRSDLQIVAASAYRDKVLSVGFYRMRNSPAAGDAAIPQFVGIFSEVTQKLPGVTVSLKSMRVEVSSLPFIDF